jgi:pimeloyl-ACP methyl ester carboxylesterase
MAADASIAVFVFDFRGYGESEAGSLGPDLVKDARAALKTAAGFQGVDKTRIAALGASIGADGAADGCLLYNQEMGGGCVGAFSFSPGNYLGMQYATVVTDLAPASVQCR